jgi:hypothetical protein
VFLFEKPRLLALLTGRHASGYHNASDPSDTFAYARKIGVTHILYSDASRRDRQILQPLLESHSGNFPLIRRIGVFRLYSTAFP